MLESVTISRRQSEIRQALAELSAKDQPGDDELTRMDTLDKEYRQNEIRFRAALVAEDQERREAGADLETRAGSEWAGLVRGFELRQVASFYSENANLSGRTAEVVEEMRAKGSYAGIPCPWEAMEVRNTIATDVPGPVQTRPIIDRLFAQTAFGRMGGAVVSIDSGALEYPVVTSAIAAGWSTTEAGNVALADAFATTDRPLAPNNNFGVQMRITRRSLKQAGDALETAMRRDLAGAISTGLDAAAFNGTGADGQPLGVIAGQATYGYTTTAVDATASWAGFRAAVMRFMIANAITSPSDVRLLIRPEIWSILDASLVTDTAVSELDRLTGNISAGNVVISANALAAPAGDPLATSALLTCSPGGVAPMYLGTWGGVDLVRDPYTDAQSGGLRITGIVTADVTISRAAQIERLTGVRIA